MIYAIVFLSLRRIEWYTWWPKKVNFKIWPRVKVMW